MSGRARAWCFTKNNWQEEDLLTIPKLGATYVVYGKEVGEKGTPHLQGYLYFQNMKSLKGLTKIFQAHYEIRRGSHQQARDYCIKDGDFVEEGIPPQSKEEQGANEKKRYQRAWELAKKGDIEEIDADIRMRLYSTIKRIKGDFQPPIISIPETDWRWYWGPTGTGKSRSARAEFPDAYIKNANKWWDGYTDQETVIIDEWSPCHSVLGHHLKQWCDHHSFSAEYKGGTKLIRPLRIIITSNYSIWECFQESQDQLPLQRRFEESTHGGIKEFVSPN